MRIDPGQTRQKIVEAGRTFVDQRSLDDIDTDAMPAIGQGDMLTLASAHDRHPACQTRQVDRLGIRTLGRLGADLQHEGIEVGMP